MSSVGEWDVGAAIDRSAARHPTVSRNSWASRSPRVSTSDWPPMRAPATSGRRRERAGPAWGQRRPCRPGRTPLPHVGPEPVVPSGSRRRDQYPHVRFRRSGVHAGRVPARSSTARVWPAVSAVPPRSAVLTRRRRRRGSPQLPGVQGPSPLIGDAYHLASNLGSPPAPLPGCASSADA
jgi:hypothetical protein